MARARKFCAYRRLERPYTRRSKFTEKSFVKANPNLKIVRFEMGNPSKKYSHTLNLNVKGDIQIRHDSMESARQAGNRYLDSDIGKNDYFLKILVYPHHILRENPLAAGAGADRMSTGMKRSFGKPIGLAARMRKDQTVFQLKVNKNHVDAAKAALKRASYKLPGSCRIEVITSGK